MFNPFPFIQAAEDDILPLGTHIKDASGVQIQSISVAKGQSVIVPIRALNCSKTLWGPDALEFLPERWMDNEKGLTDEAKALQGFHHLFTFGDGPRICIGRAFASAEFKVSFLFLLSPVSRRLEVNDSLFIRLLFLC